MKPSFIFRALALDARQRIKTYLAARAIRRAFADSDEITSKRRWKLLYVGLTPIALACGYGLALAPIFSEPSADERAREMERIVFDRAIDRKSEATRSIEKAKQLASAQREVELPAESFDERHAIVVEKAKNRLIALERSTRGYEIVATYRASFGERAGDKRFQGDRKTPEGVYRVTRLMRDIPKWYGPRAYALDYPNQLDRAAGKTGGGIWIHGSGLGKKTAPTRGCVELNDEDIVELERYVSVGSTIYIYPASVELPFVGKLLEADFLTPERLYATKSD